MIFFKHTSKQLVRLAVCGILSMTLLVSCKKYLDEKPSEILRVATTLDDLQAVLNNRILNEASPFFSEIVADNYYLTTTSWNGLSLDIRRNYIWDKNATVTIENGSWTNPYLGIYYANFVLDNLKTINVGATELEQANSIKATALYFRAFYHHVLAQLYCKQYSASAGTDLGIVVRTTADIQEPVTRTTVQQTYDRIIADLKEAVASLPVTTNISTHPNKAAAYGLLARIYLSMGDYPNAGSNANQSLVLNGNLLNFNSLSPAGNPVLPDPLTNPEISAINFNSPTFFGTSRIAIVDSVLYRSYDANDLRKTVYYGLNGSNPYWKGSYWIQTNYSIFDGIATDEQYLIRAEAYARAGNTSGAMDDLNKLLRNRYKTGTFTDLEATSPADALDKVLAERRKELAFRGLRWSDLRRFNLEGANITLKRNVNNTEYTLSPNDLRWVLLIPEVEINRSGIPQNPR